MANDIELKLGLDASELFRGIDQALSKARTEIASLPGVGESLGKGLPDAKKKLSDFVDEQKELLITLRLQGQEGSASYAQIERSIVEARAELNKFEQASKDVENSIKGIGTAGEKSGGLLGNLKSEISNAGGIGAGLVGGIAGGIATAGIGTAISAVQGLGTAIFEGAMRADEFGDKLEVAFKQQGIADVEGEINKVRESTLQLANDLGLPTERTRQLAGTVATLGGVSGKQAEDLTKLSAGIETFTDGTVKGEAVVKAFSRGLADPEGAAAIESLSKKYPQLAETLKSNIDPAQKLAAANAILGTSFETVKKQQEDAGGTFNKLSNSVNEAFETIGSGINNALNSLIPIFTESLGPAFSTLGNTISELFTRVWSVLEPILGLIGGGIMVNIVGMISVAVEALNAIYETAVYAFDQIMIALAPVFDAIKSAFGLDGAVGEGVDAMKIMQGVLNTVSGAIGGLFDVIGNVAKGIVDVFVGALKLAIEAVKFVVEGIKSFIFFIGDLISKIPGVSTVFNNLKSAFDAVYNFFSDLPRAINEVQVYLKAIGMTFQTVFGILKEAFTAALNLDFEGAANKLGSIFQSQTWVSAFSSNLAKARSELKSTTEAAKQAREELRKPAPTPPPGPKPPGGSTPKQTESDLQKSQKIFKEFLQGQQNARDTDFLNFKGTEEQKSIALKERLQKDAEEAQKKLNEIARDVSDTEFNPIEIKIKPAKGENLEDIKQFYIGEFKKLTETIEKNEIKIPVDLSWRDALVKDLQEFVKESDANAKEYEKVMAGMFTKPVNTEAKLEKAEQDFDKISELLYLSNRDLAEKIDLARSIGDQKAVESLEKIRTTNSEAIADTERRYARFVTDSKKAIDENTVYFQIGKSLELSLQNAFNGERLRQEREAQQKLRDEKLASLNAEEGDLKKSLANRSIDFAEYAARMGEIERERNEASKDAGSEFLDAIKGASDSAIATVLKSQADMFTENAKEMEGNEKIFNEFVGQALGGFSELAASGKATLLDFGKMAAGAAFDAVAKMIPSFVTGILGSSITTLGPILGPLAAATLTGALYGLLGLARSAAGFKDGVVNLEGAGSETSDSIPAWLSRGESVITAKATKENRAELEWMNKTGLSVSHFYKQKIQAGSLSVNSDGELIEEVRRLRAETRSLGSRISRNTKVEVSGLLSADSRSITAIINSERKRKMRRG